MSNPYRDWGTADAGAEYESPSVDDNNQQAKKRGWGCFVYGCLGLLAVMVLAVTVAGVGLYYVVSDLSDLTAEEPVEIPVVEASEESVVQISGRIREFVGVADSKSRPPAARQAGQDRGVDQDEESEAVASRELVLTADEINMLISTQRELRGRVHIAIRDGKIEGRISMPTEELSMLEDGKFLNATASFNVELRNRRLWVTVAGASVKGRQVPAIVITALQSRNLAAGIRTNRRTKRVIEQLESIEVRDDVIVLRLREDATADAADAEPADTPAKTPDAA